MVWFHDLQFIFYGGGGMGGGGEMHLFLESQNRNGFLHW